MFEKIGPRTGPRAHRAREQPVPGEVRVDRRRVRVEIEQAAQAIDRGRERGDARQAERRLEPAGADLLIGRMNHTIETMLCREGELRMDANLTPKEIHSNVVTQGRAMVRLIESIDVLLANSGSWRETWLLKATRGLYSHRLRGLVAALPTDVSAEILAASDNIKGPIGDVTLN